MFRLRMCGLVLMICCVSSHVSTAERAAKDASREAPLKLLQSVVLPGISGDFDHFAVDLRGRRLFLAGEDHKTVEVLSLTTGKSVRSLTGFGTPHSILYLPEKDELHVTDGGDGTIKILRASDYQAVGTIKLVEGADSIGYDRESSQLFVVTGGKGVPLDHSLLAEVDLAARKSAGEIRFESNHVEAIALEEAGPRLFVIVNVTDKNEVAVVDRQAMRVIARWTVGVAHENSPMALDEPGKRLFVVCRNPAMLVVMNTDTGAVVTSLPAAARADDVVYDRENHRI